MSPVDIRYTSDTPIIKIDCANPSAECIIQGRDMEIKKERDCLLSQIFNLQYLSLPVLSFDYNILSLNECHTNPIKAEPIYIK